ncbi:MAG: hypothetical protein ACLS9K_07480 [Lachnospira eligens]
MECSLHLQMRDQLSSMTTSANIGKEYICTDGRWEYPTLRQLYQVVQQLSGMESLDEADNLATYISWFYSSYIESGSNIVGAQLDMQQSCFNAAARSCIT